MEIKLQVVWASSLPTLFRSTQVLPCILLMFTVSANAGIGSSQACDSAIVTSSSNQH